jgi:RsiW-degrading membrane proteinase PrsW (M82 family)
MPWELALPLTAAGSGAAWAHLAARRAGEGCGPLALRALLGGVAAFGIALSGYDLAALAGAEVRFERLAHGDAGALLAALAIGLVEEGAKLIGLLLVVERGLGRGAVLAAAAGVAAGFASLEAILVLHGETSAIAFARAALGPVAHALLAAPLALGVAAAQAQASRRWALIVPALLASAALHGAADLSLALPSVGTAGFAVALAAPAVLAFALERRGAAIRAEGVEVGAGK